MSFDVKGYRLTPDDGTQVWFLNTRMNIKASAAQTGGAFTFIEWSAPVGFGPRGRRPRRAGAADLEP